MAAVPSAEDAEGSHVPPPLPCVPVSELSRRATDRAFHDIRRLANILSRVNLDSRREDLLDYIRLNRARLIKAYAVINWLSGSHGELVANAGNALAEARSQREQIDTVSRFAPSTLAVNVTLVYLVYVPVVVYLVCEYENRRAVVMLN